MIYSKIDKMHWFVALQNDLDIDEKVFIFIIPQMECGSVSETQFSVQLWQLLIHAVLPEMQKECF